MTTKNLTVTGEFLTLWIREGASDIPVGDLAAATGLEPRDLRAIRKGHARVTGDNDQGYVLEVRGAL